MIKRIAFFLLLHIIPLFALGQIVAPGSDLRVSLITCYPGAAVYELYGHTAIRITGGGIDKVYNFGLFSFNKPNFIYRFVKGETDYALGGYPFEYFLPDYIERNSKVVQQELNLNNAQAWALYSELEYLSRPENREYRYNYVLNNCATRPRDMIEKVSGGIVYPEATDTTATFRSIMRSYSGNYPWYQFGIDLALGSGIDYRLDLRKQLFAPLRLKDAFSEARLNDGRPLVTRTTVLFDGSESPILPPTPWYLTPMFAACAMLVITAGVCVIEYRRKRTIRWFDSLWFLLTGLAGSLVFFLVFVSEHEATSPNYLAFWLNPFCLFPAVTIWIKSCRKWLFSYHFINFALVLFLAAFWWALPQSANAAFFPLMLCSLLRSANYLTINRKCVKRNK